MNAKQRMEVLWGAVAAQDREAIRACFTGDAEIRWRNSNERFTREEFVRANCEYPGKWAGEVERVEDMGDAIVCIARIWSREDGSSFHAVGFYRVAGGLIQEADEYWGDDGPAPAWRKELGIGKPIK